jgi:hypothetical protein
MPQAVERVLRKYWQPISVTCACGREHGGHRIELWESLPGGTWIGNRCGTLTIDPADVETGTGGPGLAPGDKAPPSRLRLRPGRWPVWWGRCRHCHLDVRISGDQLYILLSELAARGVGRVELSTIGTAAARRSANRRRSSVASVSTAERASQAGHRHL